jgi:hemolysin D
MKPDGSKTTNQYDASSSTNDDAGVAKRAPSSGMPGPLRMSRDDQEFLPAALEIIEQPASPIRIALIWFIACVCLGGLAWSWFGHVDIHAVASGRIQPDGRSKVIQPFEPGRINAIHVANGQRVKAGAVLLELDPTEIAAEREIATAELEVAEAEVARRRAALANLAFTGPAAVAVHFPESVRPAIRVREQMVLDADISQLSASLSSQKAQIEERRAQQIRLRTTIAEREKLTSVLAERVAMRQQLVDRSTGARSTVIDAIQEQQKEMANLVAERGQIGELDAAIAALEAKLTESYSQFRADQTNRLIESERRVDKAKQDLIKANSRDGRTRLLAPIDGIVQQLAITTLGQVVTTAQTIMTLVPVEARLEVEASILNRDIGFIRVGQEVTVKVEAFPFTRYGTIKGTVIRVSDEAIDEREAGNLQDAASSTRGTNPSLLNSNNRVQNLVFLTTIALDKSHVAVGEKNISLMPGMAVTVEVRTGERRVIDYILSPIREVFSQAIKER